ncbi:MAG: hypothetical protein Tsb0027_10190 [Wenzhouxiangellaceae bacterium]
MRQHTDALILQVVAAIPAGRVASYGQIARLAGLGRAARRVAAALRRADTQPPPPWHRVLRSDGRLGLPVGSAGWHEQIQRLRSEGVAVVDGRVDLRQYQWSGGDGDQSDRDDLDSLLWRLQE